MVLHASTECCIRILILELVYSTVANLAAQIIHNNSFTITHKSFKSFITSDNCQLHRRGST